MDTNLYTIFLVILNIVEILVKMLINNLECLDKFLVSKINQLKKLIKKNYN